MPAKNAKDRSRRPFTIFNFQNKVNSALRRAIAMELAHEFEGDSSIASMIGHCKTSHDKGIRVRTLIRDTLGVDIDCKLVTKMVRGDILPNEIPLSENARFRTVAKFNQGDILGTIRERLALNSLVAGLGYDKVLTLRIKSQHTAWAVLRKG